MCNFEKNQIVSGEVTGITEYGIFLKFENNYTGMIHISEISDKFVDDINKLYVIGETLDVRIIDIDHEKKQIKLSIKEFNNKKKRRNILKEDGRGFEPLKEKLDFWVNEKLQEIENNKKN